MMYVIIVVSEYSVEFWSGTDHYWHHAYAY